MNQALIVVLALSFASCSASVRPIYNDQEQKTAERAVEKFHALFSVEDYRALYNLMDYAMRQGQSEEAVLSAMNQTYEKWGKVQSSKLDRAKVFNGAFSEVRLSYNTKYEKGNGIEWFIWKVDGNGASLVQYQNFPAKNESETGK